MTLRQSLNMLISMIGDWQVPMWVALIFAVLALVSCSINFFREYKSLFLEEGQYVKFAEKYHTKDGNIAKSIWGVVKRQNKALEKATVELHKTQEQNPNNQTQHKCLGTITSDEEGHFQFKDTFSECLGSDIKIRVIVDKKIKDFDFSIDEKKIPFFEIDLDKIALVQNIPEVIASGDQNKQA